MIHMEQQTTEGGHILTGEADLMDGHARFEQVWQNVMVEEWPGGPPKVVDSVCVGQRVWLNDLPVKDPDLAVSLWAEAVRKR